MRQQLKYFIKDVKAFTNFNFAPLFLFSFTRQFWGILSYRIDRGLFIIFRRYYPGLRVLFYPFLKVMEILSNFEIHYKADIGPGFKVLHCSNGIIISRYAKIGVNFSMLGGNVIGIKNIKQAYSTHIIIIEDNCVMGANSVLLGPIHIKNNVQIGSMALVLNDAPENAILVGVPARNIGIKNDNILA